MLGASIFKSFAPYFPNTQARMSMGRQGQRVVECLTAQTEHVLKVHL